MLTAYKNIQAALVLMGCMLLGACGGGGSSGSSAAAATSSTGAPSHTDTISESSMGDLVSQSDTGYVLAAKSNVNFYDSARGRNDDRDSARCKRQRRPKRRCDNPPAAPTVTVSYGIKQVILSWSTVSGASYYQVSKTPDGVSAYDPLANRLTTSSYADTVAVHLTDWINARYKVSACNASGCTDSAAIAAVSVPAIGYVKASNTSTTEGDLAFTLFGRAVAFSSDGNTFAVGAPHENSDATGIDGDQHNHSALGSGAVYVFVRTGSSWSQQAYIKASNTDPHDAFGWSVALSDDGNTLAVGAVSEDSNATGIDGDQNDNNGESSGAVYTFTRSGGLWSQQAYIKASNTQNVRNTDVFDRFGSSIALSGDGNTLAVGAPFENSDATGINGDQNNDNAFYSGAVYVFTRTGSSWSQQAYIKASNTAAGDHFGWALALSGDGDTLAVAASGEVIAAYIFTRTGSSWSQQTHMAGFGGSVALSGDGNTLAASVVGESSYSVAVLTRTGNSWSEQAYINGSNTEVDDRFGHSIAFSGDGNTLAVGAIFESSNAIGINGDQNNDNAFYSGAVYVFTRTGSSWSQQAYVKASNTDRDDQFGWSVALSGDGNTLAVGATLEDSSATGIGGDQNDNSVLSSGAVYLY